VKLLLDEMFPVALAEQLRARGHDAVSVHESEFVRLRAAPDRDVFMAALASDRALVTENVADFIPLEAAALAEGRPVPRMVLTTDRQFPRGEPRTFGRLVTAIDALVRETQDLYGSIFLRRR
jgi:predicted nuclease of predicted toxin-antitoxin system